MIEDEAVSWVDIDRTVERGKNARADHREARSHEPVGVPYSVVRTALLRRMGRTFIYSRTVDHLVVAYTRVISFNLVTVGTHRRDREMKGGLIRTHGRQAPGPGQAPHKRGQGREGRRRKRGPVSAQRPDARESGAWRLAVAREAEPEEHERP